MTASGAYIYGKALHDPGGPWKEELAEDTGEGMQEEGPGQRHANTWTEFAFPAGLAEVNEDLGRSVFGAPDGAEQSDTKGPWMLGLIIRSTSQGEGRHAAAGSFT